MYGSFLTFHANNDSNHHSHNDSVEEQQDNAPFIAVIETTDTPSVPVEQPSYLKLTSALRISGFLPAIPAEELKNLLFLLTFINSKGQCQASVQQLAHAMQVSEAKARGRMERLCRFRWKHQPVVIKLTWGYGVEAYTLATGILSRQTDHSTSMGTSDKTQGKNENAVDTLEVPATEPTAPTNAALEHRSQREKIIEASRSSYTRPRAEVERLVNAQIGWIQPAPSQPTPSQPAPHTAPPQPIQDKPSAMTTPLENSPKDVARRQLLSLGVSEEQADDLLSQHDLAVIQRQLKWLPYRKANHPAGLIMAAIAGDYEEPFALRQQHLTKNNDKPGANQRENSSQ